MEPPAAVKGVVLEQVREIGKWCTSAFRRESALSVNPFFLPFFSHAGAGDSRLPAAHEQG